MDAVVKEKENMIEPKEEVEDTVELIEPKAELIDEEDAKKEEIDDTEYQHMIPYEYRDYLEQHDEEEQLINSRKRRADDPSMSEVNLDECQKCRKTVSSHKRRHAIRHTTLKMYECPASQCRYKAYDSKLVTGHIKRKHKSCTDPLRKIKMTDEEKQVLENMIQECFPKNSKKSYPADVICQLCNRGVKDCEKAKTEHSNGHIDPILFKCDEPNCNFSTNFFVSFSMHSSIKHKKTCNPNQKARLKMHQETEMQKWTDICFSSKNGKEDTTETVEFPGFTDETIVDVKKEKVADNGQIPILIDTKKEVEDSIELIEPKVELIEEQDVKIEEIDDNEYQHIIPYEYRDYLDQEEQQPTSSRKRPAESSSMAGKNTIECLKCEEVTNDEQIDPKQEVIDESLELIEPKIELIDEQDVKMEEIDDTDYQHMIPYEYRDYLEHQEEEPVSCEPIPEAPKAKYRKLLHECRMCRRTVSLCRSIDAENHASTHMNLKRFECPVEWCNFKSYHDFDMTDHLKRTHSISRHLVEGRKLTLEEDQKLRSLVNECFPIHVGDQSTSSTSVSKTNSSECQKCQQKIFLYHVKRHAIRHTGLKLYECPANQCDYKAYDKSTVSHHMRSMHKSCSDPVIKNEMSDEEKQVLESMIQECFPQLDKIKLHVICQLCHQSVKDNKQAKQKHSNEHINPILFKCNEEDCDFSTNWFQFFALHAKRKHRRKFHPNDRKQQLMKQETEMQKWNDMCFSNKDGKGEDSNIIVEQDGFTCQVCKKTIKEDGCETNRRIHASEHMDILLCSVPGCQFQTKYLVAMNNHQLTVHVSEPASSSGTSFRFMAAQEWGIERMLGRCFPELINK